MTTSPRARRSEHGEMPKKPSPQERAIAQVRANSQISTDEMTDEQVGKLAVTQLTVAGIAAGDLVAVGGREMRIAWERVIRRKWDDGAS